MNMSHFFPQKYSIILNTQRSKFYVFWDWNGRGKKTWRDERYPFPSCALSGSTMNSWIFSTLSCNSNKHRNVFLSLPLFKFFWPLQFEWNKRIWPILQTVDIVTVQNSQTRSINDTDCAWKDPQRFFDVPVLRWKLNFLEISTSKTQLTMK